MYTHCAFEGSVDVIYRVIYFKVKNMKPHDQEIISRITMADIDKALEDRKGGKFSEGTSVLN